METISDIGEKELVREITSSLKVDARLLHGFGNDSAFIDIPIKEDEIMMLNTDRSGMNIAYSLGLANGKCVGDFAISHAVSDIFISGGEPLAISIALLLPNDLKIQFVKDVMLGAQEAAEKYGAFIASGDTKHSNKFAIVVSVIGKCKRKNMLTRGGAKCGDLLVAIGDFGAMITALIAHKKHIPLSDSESSYLNNALIFQQPPYKLSKVISQQGLAHAGMDNSDGLSSTVHDMCNKSKLGAIIFEDSIPISTATLKVAKILKVPPFQLCLGSGDWQHIYAVKKENLNKIIELGKSLDIKASIIGEFNNSNKVLIKNKDGLFNFNLIENDRFKVGGTNFFNALEKQIEYLGNKQ